MSRIPVFKVNCSRCTREEFVEQESPVAFRASLDMGKVGRNVEFKDLCTKCTGVIESALKELGKPVEKASRGKKEE